MYEILNEAKWWQICLIVALLATAIWNGINTLPYWIKYLSGKIESYIDKKLRKKEKKINENLSIAYSKLRAINTSDCTDSDRGILVDQLALCKEKQLKIEKEIYERNSVFG